MGKFTINKKGGSCCFEIYDSQIKSMRQCGGKSIIKIGLKWVCQTHLSSAILNDKKPIFFDDKGKEIEYTGDFLKLARGIKIEDDQLDLLI